MLATNAHKAITFDRILFATDFSPASFIATSYAVGLARRFSSTLELTNVIDLSITARAVDVLLGPALEAIRQSGEEGLQQLAAGISGVKIKKTVSEGFLPATVILCAASETDSDLIVLGTSSKHGLKKVVLGSTAEEIIRQAACPVLTVGPHVPRAAAGSLSFHRIVYATDFSPQAAKAVKYALALAQDSGAHLYLCHVISERDSSTRYAPNAFSSSSLKKLIPRSAYDWCSPECVVEHGKAAQAILALAARVNADLIVLGARKSSFWLTYVHTGLTPALLAEAKCPVLTVC